MVFKSQKRSAKTVVVLIAFALVLIGLNRFYPLLQINDGKDDDSAEYPDETAEVLGLTSEFKQTYSTYAAGLSGVTQGELANTNKVGDYLVLGGLSQGGVFGSAVKGLAGDGTSYIYLYNPDTTRNANVKITFYQVAGENIGKTVVTKSGVVLSAQSGIMEPMWIKLKSACQSTSGCNPSLVGEETPWAGFAKVTLQTAPTGFTGIFGATQTVSADGEYSAGHDQFIKGRDILEFQTYILQNVGAGYTSGKFNLRDTQILVGNIDGALLSSPSDAVVRFEFRQDPPSPGGKGHGDRCTTCRESYDLSLENGTVYGVKALLSDILNLPEGKTWSGSAALYIKATGGTTRYKSVTTATMVNSTGTVAWEQNGLAVSIYARPQLYIGAIGHGLFVDDTQITLSNPYPTSVSAKLEVSCITSGGGEEIWAPIMGYYDRWNPNKLKDTVVVPGYGQVKIESKQLFDTVDEFGSQLCSQRLLYLYGGEELSFYTNFRVNSVGQLAGTTRDYWGCTNAHGEIEESGRAHRAFRTGSDVSNTVYLPGIWADEAGRQFPDDPYFLSALNMGSTGWSPYNVGFPSGDVDVTLTSVDVVSSRKIDSSVKIVAATELRNFAPLTRGNIVKTSVNDFTGGYVVFSKDTGIPGTLLVSSNQAGKGFWRSSAWAAGVSGDSYAREGVVSEMPDEEWFSTKKFDSKFSSYVFSSGEPGNQSSFGHGVPSGKSWVVFNYNFDASANNIYADFKRPLRIPPETMGNCVSDLQTEFLEIVADGVYEICVNTVETELDLSSIIVPGSSRIVFIKPSAEVISDFTVSILPSAIASGLHNQEQRQSLVLVVEGDVVFRPGKNALGSDGGDYFDIGFVVSGRVTILSDDTDTTGVNYWQRDPVLIDGFIFAAGGIKNSRSLGPWKNTLYPSLLVRWQPKMLVALEGYFIRNSTLFDVPGVW